jgi:hypothetical protein
MIVPKKMYTYFGTLLRFGASSLFVGVSIKKIYSNFAGKAIGRSSRNPIVYDPVESIEILFTGFIELLANRRNRSRLFPSMCVTEQTRNFRCYTVVTS